EESCDCKDSKNKEKKKPKSVDEQLAKLKSEVDHWKDEYYRAYADIKNLRNSLQKEHSEAIKYRAIGFVEDLLPVLDSFQTALGNEPATKELENYLVGFKFIYRNLVNVLENEGVEEVAPKLGDEFSAETMNAVDTAETDGKEDRVVKIYRNGYKIHNRLIRPAMVSVSKNKVNSPNTNTKSAD
ncbi:MAG: nucleotide exchange factor GrpE, partial [Erysipelotrichia bacterium]|nr:nucleotide exchange factor GrpE [Erysipelotrichia bacterium]